jgi:hypothetical protein
MTKADIALIFMEKEWINLNESHLPYRGSAVAHLKPQSPSDRQIRIIEMARKRKHSVLHDIPEFRSRLSGERQ